MNNTTVAESPRTFQVQIDDKTFEIKDPVVTGRQLLDLAGKRPADEFIVLQFLSDGLLEDIRLEETTDLRGRGVERFLTFESDRIFRFILDDREFEWGAPRITGKTLKKLAEVDANVFDVWQEIRGAEDSKIGDRDEANLDAKGTERFFTAKKTTTEG
jgi:hypothetical protein